MFRYLIWSKDTTPSGAEPEILPENQGSFNIKTVSPRYGNSYVKDKTVARPSYV